MKTAFKALFLTALIAVLTGCSAQKQVVTADADSVASETLYDQALKALDEQRFIIKGDVFFLPGDKSSVKDSPDSYISMKGDLAIIHLSSLLFPRSPVDHLHIEDNAAEITKGKREKSGDMQFSIKIEGEKYWQKRRVLITLYKNTNKCHVQVKGGSWEADYVSLKGKIYPAAD